MLSNGSRARVCAVVFAKKAFIYECNECAAAIVGETIVVNKGNFGALDFCFSLVSWSSAMWM